ncbi:uncharacterized protein LOC122666059 [Telopea speciosissima]|uniref:uncharacterized protein LOC122666059 n=1 Tax=Telopea speciosissima TaxID=54955 RepID=UPI001CC53C09|nr:uncharacterized protein LOC122666059 [Telopea speciosissima]
MANGSFLFFLVISGVALVTTTSSASPMVYDISEQGRDTIIQALSGGAAHFSSWADVLTLADPSMFPMATTLFIPTDSVFEPFSACNLDASIMLYHMLPEELTFSDLL